MTDQVYRATTHLPRPRTEVFAFFSDPANLERLTPPWLSFRILTPEPLPRGEGAVYDYALRLHGLPLRWRTLILQWEEGHGFEDLQTRGPYAKWHHVHRFEDAPDGGTRMTDEVHWRLPFGWFGRLAAPLVARDVRRIFAYREEVLEGHFQRPTGSPASASGHQDGAPAPWLAP